MNWYNARHRAGDAMTAHPALGAIARSACSRRRSTSAITLRLPLRRLAHLRAAGRLAAARRDLARHQRATTAPAPAPAGSSCARASASSCTASIRCPSAGGSISWACCRGRWRPAAVLARPAAASRAPRSRPLDRRCRRSASGCCTAAGARPAARRDARMGRADADPLPRVYAGLIAIPLGILLALGRRSRLPLIRFASVVFIEFWRGVPIITVIFLASLLLPLIMPTGFDVDRLARAVIGLALRDRRLHGRGRARRPAGAARGPGRGRARRWGWATGASSA